MNKPTKGYILYECDKCGYKWESNIGRPAGLKLITYCNICGKYTRHSVYK